VTLREKQSLFARDVAKLILHAYDLGYEVTLGEAWRSPETAHIYAQKGIGTADSLHTMRLAIDLNLFRRGVYLDLTEHHTNLGAYWKSLSPQHRWGGDFRPKRDGNHYSIEWQGRR
jgi:hypothetical protein